MTAPRPATPLLRFNELELLLRLDWTTNETGTLVDVGAHIGSFSKAFADRGWKVLAFEPASHIFEQLAENLSEYPDAVALEIAVWDETSDAVDFYVSPEYWGIHSLRPFHESHTTRTTVATTRLDDALSELGVDAVTIVKIDAEGADLPVLSGFDVDRFAPRLVMCEFMDSRSAPFFGYDHHDIVRAMDRSGYVAFVSEWAAVEEHSRERGGGGPFTFLRFGRYPTTSQPVWGNLLFVKPEDAVLLDETALELMADAATAQRAAQDANDARIEQLRGGVTHRDQRIRELDEAIVQRDGRIRELGSAIVQRDRRIRELDAAIAQRDARIKEFDAAIVQRDDRIHELRAVVEAQDAHSSKVDGR